MGRVIFYALIFYLIFRLLDRFVMPAFKGRNKGNSGRAQTPKSKGQEESKKDWGGKYVDYEDVTRKEDPEE